MKAAKRLTALAFSAVLLISAASTVSAETQKKMVDFSNTDFQQAVEKQPADGGAIPGFSTKIGTPTAPGDPFVADSGVGYEAVDKPVDNSFTATVPGDKCLHFYDTNYKGNKTGGSDELGVWSYARDVEENTEYFVKLSALITDLKDNNGGDVQSRIRYGLFFFDAEGKQIQEAAADIGRNSSLPGHNPGKNWPAGFQDYQTSFVSPVGAVKARVAIWASPIYQCNAYIDNIEVYSMEETKPIIPPVSNSVYGWIHRSNITFPQSGPASIYEGEGIGYEIVDKPSSLAGSVTPTGTVEGEKCLHFFDYNYNSAAQTNGVYNELSIYSDAIPVTAGTEYFTQFSAMVGDVPGPSETRQGRFRFGILYYDGADTQIGKMDDYLVMVGDKGSPEGFKRPVDQWKDYNGSWTAPVGAVTAKIIINTTPTWIANVYLDKIEFYSMDGAEKRPVKVNNADFNLDGPEEHPAKLIEKEVFNAAFEEEVILPELGHVPGWMHKEGTIFPQQGPSEIIQGQGIGYETVDKPASLTDSVTPAGTVPGEKCLHFYDFDYNKSYMTDGAYHELYVYSDAMTVTAGTEYFMSFQAMVGDVPDTNEIRPGRFRFGIVYYDSERNQVGNMDNYIVSVGDGASPEGMHRPVDQWKNYTMGWTAPDGAVSAKMLINTTPLWVANVFVDDMEFYSMEGTGKKPLQVKNADFSQEKQIVEADLAPGWKAFLDPEAAAVGYGVVEKPSDLSESETIENEHCLKVVDTSSAENIMLVSRTMPVKEGINYQVSFDALISGTAQVGLQFYGANDPLADGQNQLDTNVKTIEGSDSTAQWSTVEHSAVAPSGAAYVAVVIMTEAVALAEKAFFDDVKLTYEFSGCDIQTPLYRLKSGDGLPDGIVGAAGEGVIVSVPYINAEDMNGQITVIVGLFDANQRLVSMKKIENALLNKEADGEILVEIQIPETVEDNCLKAIVVDGIDNIRPVAKNVLD